MADENNYKNFNFVEECNLTNMTAGCYFGAVITTDNGTVKREGYGQLKYNNDDHEDYRG